MEPLSSQRIADLKAEAHDLDATLRVGKAGLTEGLLEEVDAQLEDRALLKVRLLRSAREQAEDREALAAALAERTGSHLVEVRGNTVVLYRE